MIELTVLGCSGSYGAPAGGACSGYLVRAGGAAIWMDCGNGTFAALQRHISPEDLTAVVVTHAHPDHCVDLYGLHVLLRYGLDAPNTHPAVPVYGPAGLSKRLAPLVDGNWGGAFVWHDLRDGDSVGVGEAVLRFSRTAHPPPTLAVEVAAGGKRLVYTADTGPDWAVAAFGPGADLVLSEATVQTDGTGVRGGPGGSGVRGGPGGSGVRGGPGGNRASTAAVHLSARQAGAAAREAAARRLVLTHIWPGLDPLASLVEGSEAFGAEATIAAPHETYRI